MTWIPDEQKGFRFNEGDILNRKRDDGKYYPAKIIKVFDVQVKKGVTCNIAGKKLTPPMDDYFTAVAYAVAGPYTTEAEALKDIETGEVAFMMHAVTRGVSMFPDKYVKVTHAPVEEKELWMYHKWMKGWKEGSLSIS
jgi:hypothetical protein